MGHRVAQTGTLNGNKDSTLPSPGSNLTHTAVTGSSLQKLINLLVVSLDTIATTFGGSKNGNGENPAIPIRSVSPMALAVHCSSAPQKPMSFAPQPVGSLVWVGGQQFPM